MLEIKGYGTLDFSITNEDCEAYKSAQQTNKKSWVVSFMCSLCPFKCCPLKDLCERKFCAE